MFRSLLPFFGALLIILVLKEVPHNSRQLERQKILWEDWKIEPHLYKADDKAILLLNFSKLTQAPEPLPESGYNVTLKAGENDIPLKIAESVASFNGERLFYLVSEPKTLDPDTTYNVLVKVKNQTPKEFKVTPRPSSPLLVAAMLGDADSLQKLTSNMEDSADKFFYSAIADELQHNVGNASTNYKKALDFMSYRKNESPNMLLIKRYEALK